MTKKLWEVIDIDGDGVMGSHTIGIYRAVSADDVLARVREDYDVPEAVDMRLAYSVEEVVPIEVEEGDG